MRKTLLLCIMIAACSVYDDDQDDSASGTDASTTVGLENETYAESISGAAATTQDSAGGDSSSIPNESESIGLTGNSGGDTTTSSTSGMTASASSGTSSTTGGEGPCSHPCITTCWDFCECYDQIDWRCFGKCVKACD